MGQGKKEFNINLKYGNSNSLKGREHGRGKGEARAGRSYISNCCQFLSTARIITFYARFSFTASTIL